MSWWAGVADAAAIDEVGSSPAAADTIILVWLRCSFPMLLYFPELLTCTAARFSELAVFVTRRGVLLPTVCVA